MNSIILILLMPLIPSTYYPHHYPHRHYLTLYSAGTSTYREALLEAIQALAKPRGYAFINGKSKKTKGGRCKVYFSCDRRPPIRRNTANKVRDTQSRGLGCQFSIVGVESLEGLG